MFWAYTCTCFGESGGILLQGLESGVHHRCGWDGRFAGLRLRRARRRGTSAPSSVLWCRVLI
jgi:hypothetical protein